MLSHYLDINLEPDLDFSISHLMNALFSKLHRALVELDSQDIGISFPRADYLHLGSCLRLHGSLGRLEQLMALNWLKGMRDHVDLCAILPVPEDCKYRLVCRVQSDSNPELLRRRYIKRHNVSHEEAVKLIPDSSAKRLNLPFLSLKSQSTGQAFLLFIDQCTILNEPKSGVFNRYGLSQQATIPWF